MNVTEADLSFVIHAAIVAEFVNVGCIFHILVRREDGSSGPWVCSIVQLVMVLSLAMIFRMPVPIATHEGSSYGSGKDLVVPYNYHSWRQCRPVVGLSAASGLDAFFCE